MVINNPVKHPQQVAHVKLNNLCGVSFFTGEVVIERSLGYTSSIQYLLKSGTVVTMLLQKLHSQLKEFLSCTFTASGSCHSLYMTGRL